MPTLPEQPLATGTDARGSAAAPPPAPQPPAPDFVATLPDRPPVPRHLDPAAAIAWRTPIQEHVMSADGKAGGVLTLLGLMFTVLARLGSTVSDVLASDSPLRWLVLGFLVAFAATAVTTVVQMFRTISPQFPPAEPSLAFFGDIARLTPDEYVRRVTALSADEALKHVLSYNHTAALILVIKFRQLNLGLRAFRVAAAIWLPLAVYLVARAL
ncbi:MAG TPA: Pycsar system effector family protein [Humisphaera sp.]